LKKEIDTHFTNNYAKYLLVAKNILSNSKYPTELAVMLVTDAYEHVLAKDICGTPGYIDSVVINYMNMQIKWQKTKFKKENFIEDNYTREGRPDDKETLFNNIIDEEYVEDDHERRLAHVQERLSKLDSAGKRLYHAAIAGPHNNSGKLSRFMDINRSTCYYMIRDLKIYLKDGYMD